jgi:hypothetical protein
MGEITLDKLIGNIVDLSLRDVSYKPINTMVSKIANSNYFKRTIRKNPDRAESYLKGECKKGIVKIFHDHVYSVGNERPIHVAQAYDSLNKNLSRFSTILELSENLGDSIDPDPKNDYSNPVHKLYSLILKQVLNDTNGKHAVIEFDSRQLQYGHNENPLANSCMRYRPVESCEISGSGLTTVSSSTDKYVEMQDPPLELWQTLLDKIKAEAGLSVAPVENTILGYIRLNYAGKPRDLSVRVQPPKTIMLPSFTESLTIVS